MTAVHPILQGDACVWTRMRILAVSPPSNTWEITMENADIRRSAFARATTSASPMWRRRRFSVIALTIALAAGILETVVQVLSLDDPGSAVAGLMLRVVIYAVVATLIIFLARAHYWARMVLICAMSTIGLASLIVGPLVWLFDDPNISALINSADSRTIAVFVLRTIHLVAVAAAVTVMIRMGLKPISDRAATVDR